MLKDFINSRQAVQRQLPSHLVTFHKPAAPEPVSPAAAGSYLNGDVSLSAQSSHLTPPLVLLGYRLTGAHHISRTYIPSTHFLIDANLRRKQDPLT